MYFCNISATAKLTVEVLSIISGLKSVFRTSPSIFIYLGEGYTLSFSHLQTLVTAVPITEASSS
nr:MAG TPA: hypothetical protein [Caudoviricetes sp.]